MFGLTSTILASALTLPILATQTNDAYADNTASTDTTLKISDDVQLSVTAPTVINYKLEPDGTFICPTDATIKNNSSIPIATKSWTTNIHAGTAVSKDDFAGSSASNAWWDTVSADGGESSPFNLDTETLYDSWNMAASGQTLNDTQDDTLTLTFDGGMKNIDGLIDYNTGQQLSTITFTFGTVLNGKNEPKPDPENGIAFAVYSADDNSLNFYKRTSEPSKNSMFNGKTATAVYTGIESIPKKPQISYMQPWGQYRNEIKTVTVIDEGIHPKSLSYWFFLCINMNQCDIFKLDVSQVTDMSSMFSTRNYGCNMNITFIDFSNFNTSNVTDMHDMFYGCSNLTSINFSNLNTSNVTDMSNMFSNCKKLASLDLSGWNTSNVKYMHDMFYGCSGLSSLDLSGFDTSNVTNMNNMFRDCSVLSSLDLSGWNTSNVMSMNSMFYHCSGLTSLDLSGFDTSNVTDMSYMFSSCSGLTSLNLSDFDTSNVINMGYMFRNCSKLSDLSTIEYWNTNKVINLTSIFEGCANLTSLDLSNWDTNNATNISCMFMNCVKLVSINFQNLNTSNVTTTRSLFYKCTSLMNLDLSGLDTSNVSDMDYMFYCCSNLASINLSNWDTFNVISMNNMFSGCKKLASLDVSGFDTSKVTNMSGMFSHCSELTSLDVSGFDTSNVTSMYGVFHSCSKLFVDCSKWDTTKVTYYNDFNYNAPRVILPLSWQTFTLPNDSDSNVAIGIPKDI